jgi:N,N'-diacetyllegionaminate synthase
MKLFENKIGINFPVYFIAEIGVNHCGKISLAKQMIDAAIKSHANAVKFQTFFADDFVTKKTPKVPYQKNSRSNESHFDMIKSLELNYLEHVQLINYCKKKKIHFISTPYNLKSAIMLSKLGCKVFKTSSADLVDLELHTYLAKKKKTVIISTGMSSVEEIDECIKIYKKYKNKNIVLMHCVSNYPCSNAAINIRCFNLLKKYNYILGYSDHSLGNLSSILSVSLGAAVIEKHFTTNKNLSGPDQKTSILPKEFLKMVNQVKKTITILGKEKKFCQKEELKMKAISRKSLTLNKNFTKGDILKKKDLTLKRPGTGLYFKNIKKIIGKKAKKNLRIDYQVKYKDFY